MYFKMALNHFDLLGYVDSKVLFASFLALCRRVHSGFPVIRSCLEKMKIIINAMSTFCMGIFFGFGIVSQSASCSPNLVAEYLAVWNDFVENSSGRADLT
jgi:hypothetical protein